MENTDWMKSLKPGDKVFVSTSYFSTYTIAPDVVERVGKSMVILQKSTVRFRFNGDEVGRSLHTAAHYLHPDNEEFREKFWIQENRKHLSRVVSELANIRMDYIHLTREQIERLVPILTAVRDELNPPKVQP